jgi:hypothetical protein
MMKIDRNSKLEKMIERLVREIKVSVNDLGGPTMDYVPKIAMEEHRAIRDKVAKRLIKLLSKAAKMGFK